MHTTEQAFVLGYERLSRLAFVLEKVQQLFNARNVCIADEQFCLQREREGSDFRSDGRALCRWRVEIGGVRGWSVYALGLWW